MSPLRLVSNLPRSERPTEPPPTVRCPREKPSYVRIKIKLPFARADLVTADLTRDPRSEDYAGAAPVEDRCALIPPPPPFVDEPSSVRPKKRARRPRPRPRTASGLLRASGDFISERDTIPSRK